MLTQIINLGDRDYRLEDRWWLTVEKKTRYLAPGEYTRRKTTIPSARLPPWITSWMILFLPAWSAWPVRQGQRLELRLRLPRLHAFLFLLLLFLFLHGELKYAYFWQAKRIVALLPSIGCFKPLDSLGSGKHAAGANQPQPYLKTFIHGHESHSPQYAIYLNQPGPIPENYSV